MVNKYLYCFTVSHILSTLNSRLHLALVPVTEKLIPDTLVSLTGCQCSQLQELTPAPAPSHFSCSAIYS